MMIGRPGITQRPPLRDVSASAKNETMPVSPARTPTTPRLSMRKATGSYSDVAKKAAASLASATSEEDRAPVYSDIYEFLRFADSSSAVSLWNALPTGDVVSLLTDDIIAGTSVIALATCNVFNHLVRHTAIAKSFPDGAELLVEMCRGVLRRTDKPLYSLCMSCIANQKMNTVRLESKLGVILGLWEELMRSPSPSSVMLMEGINALQRLQTDFPVVLEGNLLQCINVLYPLLVSNTPKVRTKVLAIMVASKEKIVRLGGSFLVRFAPDFKKTLNTQLLVLMDAGNELYVLEVWSLLVELLGKALHQGPFINETLKIAQQAFRKQSVVHIQAAAFKAWRSLIANFETDPKVLAVPKRLALIMKPLQSNITAVPIPSMDEARAVCWWRLVEALGGAVASHFSAVCVPLLEFCLVPVPAPRDSSLVSSSAPATRLARCPRIGCQILASVLETRLPPHPGSNSIAPLTGVVLPTETFVAELSTLSACVCSLATCCTDAPPVGAVATSVDTSAAQDIVPASWLQSVLTAFGHRLAMLVSTSESSHSQVLHQVLDDLLACLRSLVVAEKPSPSPVRLLLQTILSLPESILLVGKSVQPLQRPSSADNRASDSSVVPAVVLLAQTWFLPQLLSGNLKSERYIILYERLVVLGLQSVDVLDFVQALVALLNSSYGNLRVVTELPWRLWSVLAHRLHQYLVQEQKVAQGARLAPHFTAIHQTLVFAANRLLHLKLPQATQRDLVKTWVDLYRAFATAAALNEDVESNEWLHGLCDEIMLDSRSLGGLHSLVQLIDAVVECADFSAEPKVVKSISMSPFKHSPSGQSSSVGNLRPLLELLRRVSEVTYDGLCGGRAGGSCSNTLVPLSPAPAMSSAGPASAQLMSTLTRVFSQLSSPEQILGVLRCLCPAVGPFLTALDSKQGALTKVTFPSGFVAKLEKLWTSLLTCVQSRFNRPFDSELLASMGLVLASCLDHTNRAVRTRTLVFWNATFATTTHLEYPTVLRPTLSHVKKKSPITLPGWVDEISGTSEPMTELNTEEAASQEMLLLRRDVSASPKKTWGSFLGRGGCGGGPSPSRSPFMKSASTGGVSPARSPAALATKSPSNRNVRRRLPLSFDAESAQISFVRIESSKEKKSSSFLTDHQQEMKDRKAELPALYSLVDQSQESTTSKFGSLKRKSTADSPPAGKRAFSTSEPAARPSLAFLVDEDTQFDMPLLHSGPLSTGDDNAMEAAPSAPGAVSTATPTEEAMFLVVEETCDGTTTTTTTTTATSPVSKSTATAFACDSSSKNPASSSTTAVSTTVNDELATMPYNSDAQQQQQEQDTEYHAPPETPTIKYIPASQPPCLGDDAADTNDADYALGKSLQPATMMSQFNFIDESTQDHKVPIPTGSGEQQMTTTSAPPAQAQPLVLMMPHMSPILHRSRSPSPRNAVGAAATASRRGDEDDSNGSSGGSGGGGMINDTLCLSSLFTSTPRKPSSGATLDVGGTAEANKTTRDLSSLIEQVVAPASDDPTPLLPETPNKPSRLPNMDAMMPYMDATIPTKGTETPSRDVVARPSLSSLKTSTPARLISSLQCHRSVSASAARHLRSGRTLSVTASAAASPIVSPRTRSSRKRKYVDDSPGGTGGTGGGSSHGNSTPDGSSMVLQIFTPDASVVFVNPDSNSMPPPSPLVTNTTTTERDAVRSPPPNTNISCSRVHPNSAAVATEAGDAGSLGDGAASPVVVVKRGRGRPRKGQVHLVRTHATTATTSSPAVASFSSQSSNGSSQELAPTLHTPSKSVPARQRATRLASRRQLQSLHSTPIVLNAAAGDGATTTVVPETQSEDMDQSQTASPLSDSLAATAAFHDAVAASASPAFRQKQMTARPGPTPSSSSGPVSVRSSFRSHAKCSVGKNASSAAFPPPSEDDLTSSLCSGVLPPMSVDDSDSIIRGDLFADIATESQDGYEVVDKATTPPKTTVPDSQPESIDVAGDGGEERSGDLVTAAAAAPSGGSSSDSRQSIAVVDAAEKRGDDVIEDSDDAVAVPHAPRRRVPADLRVTRADGVEAECAATDERADDAHRSPPQLNDDVGDGEDGSGGRLPTDVLRHQQLTPVLSLTPSECSPSPASSCAALSPSSILKTGPSSTHQQRTSHQRRVTFDLPEEVTSSPLDSPRRLKRHGGRPPRRLDMKQSILRQRSVAVPDGAVYPPLVMSADLVERILPSLSSGGRSRGLLQLMKSRNIRTVGDLACLTPEDIASLPIRAPKVKVLVQALESFHVTRFSPGCTPKRQHIKRAVRRFTAIAADSNASSSEVADDDGCKDSSCASLQQDLESICNSSAESSIVSSECDLDVSFAPDSLVGEGDDAENVDPTLAVNSPIEAALQDLSCVADGEGGSGSVADASPAAAAIVVMGTADTAALQSGDSTLVDDSEEEMDCDADMPPSPDLAPSSARSPSPVVPASRSPSEDTPAGTSPMPGVESLASFSVGSDDETQDPSAADAAAAAAAVVYDAGRLVSGMIETGDDECLVPESEHEPRAMDGGDCVPETAPLSEAAESPSERPASSVCRTSTPVVVADAAAAECAVVTATGSAEAARGDAAFDCGDVSDELDTSMALEEIDSLIASSQCTMDNFDIGQHSDEDDDASANENDDEGDNDARPSTATGGASCPDSQLDITSSGGCRDRHDDHDSAHAALPGRQPVAVDTQSSFSLQAGQGVAASATATTMPTTATANNAEQPPRSPSVASVYDDALDTQCNPDDDDDHDAHNASCSSLDSQLPEGDGDVASWRHATSLFESLTGDELESWSPRHLCNLQVQLSQLMGRVAYAIRSTAAPRRQPRL